VDVALVRRARPWFDRARQQAQGQIKGSVLEQAFGRVAL
jgi:hypothetical protein